MAQVGAGLLAWGVWGLMPGATLPPLAALPAAPAPTAAGACWQAASPGATWRTSTATSRRWNTPHAFAGVLQGHPGAGGVDSVVG